MAIVVQKQHVCWIGRKLLFHHKVPVPLDSLIEIGDDLLRVGQAGRRSRSLTAQSDRSYQNSGRTKKNTETSNANLPSFTKL